MVKSADIRRVAILVLLTCLLSVAQFAFLHPAFSTSDTALSFSPSHMLVGEGTDFTIDLSLTNCPLFQFFDIVIAYNNSILDALNARITVPWPGFAAIDDEGGAIEFYVYSNGTFLSGNLTLGEIEFRSLTQGNSTLQFSEYQIICGSTSLLVAVSEGQVEVLVLNLTVSTTSRFYCRGQNITAFGNITAEGAPVNGLVGIEVRDPSNNPIAMRTVTAGNVPQNTLWKVNITNFHSSDQYGNQMDSFDAGSQGYFYVAWQNLWNETLPVFIAVNVYDGYGGTVGFISAGFVAVPNSIEDYIVPVYIPPKTLNGTTTACAGVFSGKPSEGGYPYLVERATSFQVINGSTTPPIVPPSNMTFQGGFNLTFRPSSIQIPMGEFSAYASANYIGLDASAQTEFAHVNMWVSNTDPNANYTTIHAAINAANTRADAIYVAQGTYTENVVVNKTALTIIGDYDNPTIVDGGLTDNVLCITEPYARVINLRIMNSGATTDHNIGIKVTASSCDLRNNTVLDNGVGIAVKSSSSASISENNVYNNTNGVSVDNFSNFASISENNVYNNTNNGVLVDNASYISINGNLMENNGIGLQLVDTDSANITENQVISNNQGIVLEGLLSCNDSLSGNNVSANNIGVELHLATNNSVVGNNIASNTGFGVQILDADYIKVYGNNFVENGVQAYSNTTTNKFDAGYPAGGNYWSDYNGSDLYSGSFQDEIGSDGIGDVPYSFAVGGLDNYPFVKPSYWQDMGIANLFSGVLDPPFVKTILGQDYSDHIGVRIINYGSNRHVSNVTLYANNTIIGQETITVEGRGFSALTFLWNTSTFSLGVYRVRALVSPFEGDMNMTNNQYILGSWVTLTIPGDVNGDGYVGPESLNTLLVSYGAPFSPDRPYNPNCDIDDSGYIGPENLNTLLVYFGQPET